MSLLLALLTQLMMTAGVFALLLAGGALALASLSRLRDG